MIRYINMRTREGVETVDELDSAAFKTMAEFKKELFRLLHEYRLAGHNVWSSQCCTKCWR